jgi:hypothetical protein
MPIMAALPPSVRETGDRMPKLAMAGVHPVVVEIGGASIRLLADDAFFLQLVQERYEGFLSYDSRAAMDLTVHVAPRADSEQEDIRVARDSGLWSAERWDFRLDWDPESKSGRLQQGLHAYSLDAALRVLHTLLLAGRGGFLLHAASAIRNRRAHLFFGPSGAGKTTLARLAPRDATLLTDEISYVRGDCQEYLAYGTPFTGEMATPGENISAPITAVYELVKASTNRLTPIKPGDAVRALLESVLFFAEDPNLVRLVFQSVCDLVCRLPVYRLEFVADQSVWDLVQ